MIVQAGADGFGMRPPPEHMRRALAHEFGARIGKFLQRAKLYLLNLRLLDRGPLNRNLPALRACRTGQDERRDSDCGTDMKMHDGLTGNFLEASVSVPSQRTATRMACRAEVTAGEPV